MSAPSPAEAQRLRQARRVLSQLLPYLRPYRGRLTLAGLSTLGAILIGIARPWPIKVVVDQVILGRDWALLPAPLAGPEHTGRLLLACCAAVLLIAACGGLLLYAKTLLLAFVGQRIVAKLREEVHDRLLRLSLGFHATQRSGDLLVRLSGDTVMMRQLLVEGIFALGQEALMVAGVLAVIAWLDPALAVVAGLVAPVVAGLMVVFGRRLRETARQKRQREGQIGSAIQESLSALPVIQAYALEAQAQKRFARRNRKSLKAGLTASRLEGKLSGWTEMTLAAGTALTLWIGVQRVLAGALSAGEVIVLLSYVRALYRPLRKVVTRSSRLFKSVACGERVLDVLRARATLPRPRDPLRPRHIAGRLTFDRVGFAYGPGRPVLRDVTLEVEPGETVAILGTNGSGKSTLASFVPRLRDVDSGRVAVDGHDVRQLDLELLRRSVAVLFQETILFDGTLRENIRLGRPDASEADVERAARLAGVSEFAAATPAGLETEVGERGIALSGGQRQRIALARAILRDAPVVVLDEPTTSLDAESEQRFTTDLLERLAGRTVLLMTHNHALLSAVDRVVVLRDGTIDEVPHPAGAAAGSGPDPHPRHIS